MTKIPQNKNGAAQSPATSDRMLVGGAVTGAVYGIVLRMAAGFFPFKSFAEKFDISGASVVMTWAFVLGGPFVIGFLCVAKTARRRPVTWWGSIWLPWISVLMMMLGLFALAIEGFICIVMAIPIALALGSLGGITAKIYVGFRSPSASQLSCLALLPLIAGVIEVHAVSPTQTRTVTSEIRIHASPETVWSNIERVPAIAPSELQTTWTHRIGFPRPVEATLSREGVGGVRQASFEHGLLFIETVTAWEPQRRLAFSIKADSAHIPTTTLDEHVTIGGRYFDVLDGEYWIEPQNNGDMVLHLVSHQRLSTDFNGYAGFWTDAVMQNLQTSILKVIKHRCEHA